MQFSTLFQLYLSEQCTYPCFSKVSSNIFLYNILSKPVGRIAKGMSPVNWKKFTKLGITSATPWSQIQYTTEWSTVAWPILFWWSRTNWPYHAVHLNSPLFHSDCPSVFSLGHLSVCQVPVCVWLEAFLMPGSFLVLNAFSLLLWHLQPATQDGCLYIILLHARNMMLILSTHSLVLTAFSLFPTMSFILSMQILVFHLHIYVFVVGKCFKFGPV